MKKEIWVKSKLNVLPSKGKRLFCVVLNFCLVIVMVVGLISILMDGFQIGTVGYMCISYLVVTSYRKRPENSEHYEFALAMLTIDTERIEICYSGIEQYKGEKYIVQIPTRQIEVLEYSDQLTCLHIRGTILRAMEKTDKQEKGTDHFLYITKEQSDEILRHVAKAAGKEIVYMDR